MDATELRLGNLFIEKYSKEIIKVVELSSDIIHFNGVFNQKWQAEPIPLTEEWLLKFGFDKKDRVINGNFNIGVLYYNGGIDYFEFDVTHIKHVHSLQNLYFSLTQKELTYE